MSEAIDPGFFTADDEEKMEYPRFTVTNDEKAEWCLLKIREAKEKQQKWKAHYAEQMRKIDEKTVSDVLYFEALLADYFETVPHKRAKTQESYSLPSGKLVMKRQQPEFSRNDEALVPWLEQNAMEQLVSVKKTANWSELKKRVMLSPDGKSVLTEEGEVIPGITVTPREDVFRVEMEG